MRLSVYSVLGAFVWSAPFAAALTTATNVTAANGTQQLRNCVVGALINGDANSRIVDATNDTYTDARMGEKIQYVLTPAMTFDFYFKRYLTHTSQPDSTSSQP